MSGRILVTGSRDWIDEDVIYHALDAAVMDLLIDGGTNADVTLVSGACPTGADVIAERLAEEGGLRVERHPADWAKHGKAAGPIRNQHMVDLGADICIAFPLPTSRGTKHCMEAGRRAGILVRVFEPMRAER